MGYEIWRVAHDLPAEVEETLRRARARWPGVDFRVAALVRALATPPLTVPAQAEERCLALACAAGDAAALAAFEREFLPDAIRSAARLSSSPEFGAEVAQALRLRLFLSGPERPARIGDYDGSTPLLAWVRVIARHCAVDLLRLRTGPVSDPARLERLAHVETPELSLAQDRLHTEFHQALGEAVRSLSSRDRSALRLHLAEGIPLEGLAKAYGVHRSSVVRWLATARATVLERTRQNLSRRLGQSEKDVDSLLRAARSNLDVDISSVFRSTTPIPT